MLSKNRICALLLQREKITAPNSGFLNETLDMNAIFDDFVNVAHGEKTQLDSISKLRQFVTHPDFNSWEWFLDARFCSCFPIVMRSSPNSCNEIIGQLWSLVDRKCELLGRDLAVAVARSCVKEYQREISPSAFFALSNYAAISKECRDLLVDIGVPVQLVTFLKCFTSRDAVAAGMRLLGSFLSYSDANWSVFYSLIPILRHHLRNQDFRNRRLAGMCLCRLVAQEEGFNRSLACEVHTQALDAFMLEEQYYPEIVQLLCIYASHGCHEMLLDEHMQFIQHLRNYLFNELDLFPCFELLRILMPYIHQYLEVSGIINDIEVVCSDGNIENKKNAVLTLLSFSCFSEKSYSNEFVELFSSIVNCFSDAEQEELKSLICPEKLANLLKSDML